jgi:hypothetical protein
MSADLMEAPELTGIAIRCPGCGSFHTAAVNTAVQHNVLCKTCGSCWHLAGGNAERIDPRQCPGCALRRICTAAAG